MPVPQLIQPTESLESGFRNKYNVTAGAIPTSASVTDGVISFYGLGNVLLFALPLSTVFALKSELPLSNGGEAVSFESATEETEGVARIATLDEAYEGTNEFKFITPALLTAVFGALPRILFTNPAEGQTITLHLNSVTGKFELVNTPAPTLQTVTDKGATTDKDVSILGGLSLDNIPSTDTILPFLVLGLDNRVYRSSVAGGSGSGTTAVLTNESIELIARYTIALEAWLNEQPGSYLPVFPVLTYTDGTTTGPPASPVINFNASKYEESIGLTLLANCSNGESFYGRVIAKSGPIPPDQSWHLMERFDGSIINGSYSFNVGFLDAGDYTTQIRVNVDLTSIVSKDITVALTEPIGTDSYRIIGNTTPSEPVQDGEYYLEQYYSNRTWQRFTGYQVWVIPVGPVGLGIGNATLADGKPGAKLSGDPDGNIITVDTPFTIRCYIGVNIELPCILKNTEGTTTPTLSALIISGVFGRDEPGVGRIGLCNATAACETRKIRTKVNSSGIEVVVSTSAWFAGEKIGGTYGAEAGGATLRYIWGYDAPTEPGTYYDYEEWRPTGNTEERQVVKLTKYVRTISSGSTTTPWQFDPAFGDPVIANIDWQWVRLRTGDPYGENRVYLFINVTGVADSVQVDYAIAGEFGRQSAMAAPITGDAKNYRFGFNINGFTGAQFTFYIAPINDGTAYTEITKTLTIPAGPTTARQVLHP